MTISHTEYGKRSEHPSTQTCPKCSPELAAKIRANAAGHELRSLNTAGENAVRRHISRRTDIASDPRDDLDSREATLRHIRSAINYGTKPSRKSAELISRMSERDVYDLAKVRTDPMNRQALRGELIDRARRANDLARYPTAGRDQERAQERIDDLLRRQDSESWNGSEVAHRILATGSPAYRTAFAKIIISQLRMTSGATFTPEEAAAVRQVNIMRAMAESGGTQGGFSVPFQLDSTLVPVSAGSRNSFRKLCRVVQISGANEWRQAVASTAMVASYGSEASVTTDNSPVLGQAVIGVKRATAFAPVSLELTEDWANLQGQLGQLIIQARDDLEAVQFVTGTGTNTPEGLITGATGITPTTGAFDLASDLYPVETALAPRFREAAIWFANRAQFQLMRQFAQPETSAPIFAHVPGGPTEVIGYSAHEASGMTATSSSGQKITVLFDPSYYVIVDRIGLDLEVTTWLQQIPTLPGVGLPTGQRGILGLWRNSAKLIDPAAARVLQVA